MKKTSDLLLVMSNLFKLTNGTLIMSPQRIYPSLPLVKLGDPDFTKVSVVKPFPVGHGGIVADISLRVGVRCGVRGQCLGWD